MEGESNVLTKKPIGYYCRTSGTTGPSKHFAHTDRPSLFADLLDTDHAIVAELCPNLGRLQKRLLHYVHPHVSVTRSGATNETALTVSNKYNLRSYTTPPAGFRINSFIDANYIHLLFGQPWCLHLPDVHTPGHHDEAAGTMVARYCSRY